MLTWVAGLYVQKNQFVRSGGMNWRSLQAGVLSQPGLTHGEWEQVDICNFCSIRGVYEDTAANVYDACVHFNFFKELAGAGATMLGCAGFVSPPPEW